MIKGSSANARPGGKNHPLEKILCEPFAGFSAVEVQWQGLRQGLPSSCSRKFLWQVSMLIDFIRSFLYNIIFNKNCIVDVCAFDTRMNHSFLYSYKWVNPVVSFVLTSFLSSLLLSLICCHLHFGRLKNLHQFCFAYKLIILSWRNSFHIHTYFRMRFRGSRTSIRRVKVWPLHIGLWLTYAFYSHWIEEIR